MGRKNVYHINLGNFGSTGTIARGIINRAEYSHYSGKFVYPGNRLNKPKEKTDFQMSPWFIRKFSEMLQIITGFSDCFAVFETLNLVRYMDKCGVDLVHIHNLHGSYINLPIFFRYIKRRGVPVIWTLHDCWSFTGHCPHFDMIKCDKWKTGCNNCPQFREYPQSFFDNSKFMWKLKKRWFTGVKDLTIVTPSQWLANLVSESFLKNYPVMVIHNGIDLSVFNPNESKFRTLNNIPDDEFMVLGVAFGWGSRKGLDVFTELSKRLPKKYHIVLVGTDADIDRILPEGIISIHRTQNQQELAEVYSSADLFVNPTREENYPTVNMESLACGTPVLTFKTGGSPEIVDETCGSVVPCNDIDALEKEIIRICETKPYSKEACLKRAKAFDMNDRFAEYIELYKKVLNE